MEVDARISALLIRWKQARDHGHPVSIEELCHDCPELVEPLRHEVEVWETMEARSTNPRKPPVRETPTTDSEGPLVLKPGIEPVPGYRLVSVLGRGAFGEVWKAQGPGGFSVAMKFIRRDNSAGDVEARSLEFMKSIRHTNLLSLFGAWTVDEYLVVAMELGDGTLQNRLKQATAEGHAGIPGSELLEYMNDAAKAIDFLNEPCHELAGKPHMSIVHRDIKPQNLLLVGGGVKVADFGLAKLLESSFASNTGSMTVAYAAPEFFDGRTSSRSDQYSLAATYCHLRGGRLPYSGNAAQIMAGHMTADPDLGMLPEPERAVVARALSKNPADRWPTCRAFVKELSRCSSITEAAKPGPVVKVEAPSATSRKSSTQKTVPTTARPSGRWHEDPARAASSSRRWGAVAGVALLLVCGAVTAYVLGYLPLPIESSNGVPEKPVGIVSEKPRELPPPVIPDIPRVPTPLVVTKDPVEPKPPESNPAETHVTAGLKALEGRDFAAALAHFDRGLALAPTHAVAHCGRGTALRHLYRYDDAVASLTKAIAQDPTMARAHTERAQVYNGTHDWEGALADANEAIRLDAKDADAYLARAAAYLDRGDYDAAASDCEKVLRMKPDLALAHSFRGRIYSLQDDPERGLANAMRAVELAGQSPLVLVHRGQTQMARRQYDLAIADFDRAVQIDANFAAALHYRGVAKRAKREYPAAIEDLSEALKRNPFSWMSYISRGRARVGDTSGAKEDYEKAITLAREKLKAQPRYAQGYYLCGEAEMGLFQYDKAVGDFTELLRVAPNHPPAYERRGLAHYFRKEYEQAVADQTEAIKLRPKSAYLRVARGDSYRALKNTTAAIEDYTQGLVRDPDNISAHFHRGLLYREQQRPDDSIADFTELIRLQPTIAGNYYNRSIGYRAKREHDKAIADLDEAIRISPNYASAFNERGLVYCDKYAYDRGIRDLSEAIRLSPRWAAAHRNRGWALDRLGQHREAIENYDKALELEPGNAYTLDNRAYAYRMTGDFDRAIRDCDEAIRVNDKFFFPYFNRAMAYAGKNQLNQAIRDFGEALKIEKNVAAFNMRARLYNDTSKFDEAEADASESIRMQPLRNAEAYFQRGFAHGAKQHWDAAIRDYTFALEADPKLVWAYNNRGNAYLAREETSKALADFNRSIELDAKPLNLRNRARLYDKIGESAKAKADREHADRLEGKAVPPKPLVAPPGSKVPAAPPAQPPRPLVKPPAKAAPQP